MTDTRQTRAVRSLEGLSVGDALGERFFGHPPVVLDLIARRVLPDGPWRWTDDTQMSLSIVDTLLRCGRIDQDHLAEGFARRYDRTRGYGGGAHELLAAMQHQADQWRVLAPAMFDGTGSYGNGAAMRVAPLGAYFADDLEACVVNARLSAEVTHAHPEGVAGAIAVSIAAALAVAGRHRGEAFLREVAARTPPSKTRDGILEAVALDATTAPEHAAEKLGCGWLVSAFDTVPFTLWSVANYGTAFVEAFWTTVGGLGDRDTTCAIVGGVVAAGGAMPPTDWVVRREPLPEAA